VFDGQAGLHQNYFRDFDPATGRYVEPDPIGLYGGLDVYAYVDGNPISEIDPFGLMGAGGGGAASHPLPCNCPKPPLAPPGASCPANVSESRQHSLDPFWFKDQVKNRSPWDYKRSGKQYEDFGNFNFGVVAAAFGFPYYVAQNGAGIYQQTAGAAAAGQGTPLVKWPYGDDPADAKQIQAGYRYFICGCYK
jgi:RHS repeat-associated protein